VAEFVLEAEPREVVGKKVKQMRAKGIVPISVYGPKVDTANYQVSYRPLEVMLMKAGGTNLIDVKAGKQTHTVLAREVQRDVLKGTILHVDFFAVDENTPIRADIPIHLVGESPVVASREGILLTGTNTVTIETLPRNLMNLIEVDLSRLVQLGDSITVADLDLGADVVILNEPEDMLARVAQTSAARAQLLSGEEEGDLEGTVDQGAEPEVIARHRDEEDEE
jgi:large subunit ribosomal protein L25